MIDFEGIDPPEGLINPDYKQHPGNSRKCVECGKTHDTIVEDTWTGERIIEIEKCKDCLMSGCKFNFRTDQVQLQTEWCGTARCMTSDGRNLNIAEELNRLENQLLNESKMNEKSPCCNSELISKISCWICSICRKIVRYK